MFSRQFGLSTSVIGFLALIMVFFLPAAEAHRQHYVWTELALGADQTSAQVTHRLHQHDAIAWLRQRGLAQPNLSSTRHLARLVLYVSEQSRFWRADGERATSELLGAELDGNYVLVYQEILAPSEAPTRIDQRLHRAKLSVFDDLYSDQRNRLNVVHKGDTHSVEFRSQTPAKALLAGPVPD